MSIQEQRQQERAGETEINAVIDQLKRDFESIDANANQNKTDKIIEAANRLKEIGMPPKSIASELVGHAKELRVDRSWIYAVLPQEFKRKERSDAIKEGMSSSRHPTNDEEQMLRVASGGHIETPGDDSSGGAVPSGALGSRSPMQQITLDSFMMHVDSLFEQVEPIDDEWSKVPTAALRALQSAKAKMGYIA